MLHVVYPMECVFFFIPPCAIATTGYVEASKTRATPRRVQEERERGQAEALGAPHCERLERTGLKKALLCAVHIADRAS